MIVQSSGPIEVLVEQVEALGGTVNLVYENVPAVAISLPGGRLGALTEAPGATWVEKDRLISLDDSSSNSKISPAGNYGRRSPAGASALNVNDSTGVKVKPIDPRTLLRQPSPLGYTNYLYTGAGDIWPETRYGKGSVVAVVDTGTVANHCLQYALTGAPGFPDGFNATEDGIPANSPENHWHGTFVGGVIASSCSMDFSAYPPDPLYLAISAYLPYPVNFVPVFGQAPSAKIYPVKVFDVTGEETPTSVVLKGLDHLLTLKKENLLDIRHRQPQFWGTDGVRWTWGARPFPAGNDQGQDAGCVLRLEGYTVNSVPNGQADVEYVRTHPVELMVVDLRMPGMDGLEVVQVVNQISPETEIILLTAFGTTESAIQALRLRIHDYLLKPAAPAQVVNSIKKGLSRREARLKQRGGISTMDVDEGPAEFSLKDGTHIDLSRRQVRKKDQIVHLTPAEGRLLRVLIENPGRVYSHRELVLLVQGYDTSQREAPEILRPLVSRLRHKLEAFPALSDRVVSLRGTGYLYEGDK